MTDTDSSVNNTQPPPHSPHEEEHGDSSSDEKTRKRSISKKACEHCKKSHACCEGLLLQNHWMPFRPLSSFDY